SGVPELLESTAAVRHALRCHRQGGRVLALAALAALAGMSCLGPARYGGPVQPYHAGGPGAPGASDAAPGVDPAAAEVELPRLGNSTEPGPTLQRSRVLRELGRHADAV